MENKAKESKVKPLGTSAPVKDVQTEGKKYSHEELEKIAIGLSEQLEKARVKLMQYEELLNIKRLDYLFACLQNKDCFNKEFIVKAVKEIETSLIAPESEEGSN